jgi:hypothetical protein
MDKIYSQACLTLIGGAGEDSSYGLPGVGKRTRQAQAKVKIRDLALVQVFPHTAFQLGQSKWATRGWTYQECYLARKRLIFTDHQISYLCNTMHCAETIRKPLNLELAAGNKPFLGIIPSKSIFDSRKESRGLIGLNLHLQNYSERNLTYDSDSLNAILGILRFGEESGFRHIHGMPLRRSVSKRLPGLAIPLGWYHLNTGRRRSQFPSWSWAGWKGGIRMDDPDIRVPEDCEIELTNQTGKSISLQGWFDNAISSSAGETSSGFPPMLRVKAMTVTIAFQSQCWSSLNDNLSQMSEKGGMSFVDGPHTMLPIEKGISALTYAYLDEPTSLDDDDILGLIVWPKEVQQDSPRRSQTVLLLKPDGRRYHRVGILRVRHGCVTRPAGNLTPQIVYMDDEGSVLEEIEYRDECPLWLQGAAMRTVDIV